MLKKFIMNLGLSMVSGPDCITVMALKNFEPELSFTRAELLNNCLKEFGFPDCWKVSPVVPVFKNIEYLQLKNTTLLVFFQWFVKYLKNL